MGVSVKTSFLEGLWKRPRGHGIECATCGGSGLIATGTLPNECADCGGSGRNWQYPNGAIARYYSGPLIGRADPAKLNKDQH